MHHNLHEEGDGHCHSCERDAPSTRLTMFRLHFLTFFHTFILHFDNGDFGLKHVRVHEIGSDRVALDDYQVDISEKAKTMTDPLAAPAGPSRPSSRRLWYRTPVSEVGDNTPYKLCHLSVVSSFY